MKKIICAIAFVTSIAAFANDGSVTLTAYTESANYHTSAYSFRKLSQDEQVTGNKYELLFQPGDKFDTKMVVGDVGSIVDLGAISCADIKNSYEQTGPYPGKGHGGYPYKEDRKLSPMFWITYSEAWDKLSATRSSEAPALAGHCYIVHQASSIGVTVTVFHVKSLDSGKSVTIDQMEVFQNASFKNAE